MDPPLISVIIPAYNAAGFLPEAVASIRAQAYGNLEIIIVNDGSTDGTEALLNGWNDVRCIHQENCGPAEARNVGIRAATGTILAFLDADDLWTPDHLARLLSVLESKPALRFAWGASRVVRLHRNADGTHREQLLHPGASFFQIGAGLYRRDAFDEVGLFNPARRLAEDIAWIAKARGRRVAHVRIPETVLVYRRHADSMTAGHTFWDVPAEPRVDA